MSANVKVDINQILAVLRNTPEIIGAWIFGSAKEGNIKRGSDLDIGILFDANYKKDLVLKLHSEFVKNTAIDKFDIIDLNTANSILRFEAISGNLIYTKDDSKSEERIIEFFSLTCREYEDEMALIEKGWKYYKEFN